MTSNVFLFTLLKTLSCSDALAYSKEKGPFFFFARKKKDSLSFYNLEESNYSVSLPLILVGDFP